MPTVYKSKNEIPTIDCELITIETVVTPAQGSTPAVTREFGFTTANKLGVEPQIETTDAVKLMIKGKLKARSQDISLLLPTTFLILSLLRSFRVVLLHTIHQETLQDILLLLLDLMTKAKYLLLMLIQLSTMRLVRS